MRPLPDHCLQIPGLGVLGSGDRLVLVIGMGTGMGMCYSPHHIRMKERHLFPRVLISSFQEVLLAAISSSIVSFISWYSY